MLVAGGRGHPGTTPDPPLFPAGTPGGRAYLLRNEARRLSNAERTAWTMGWNRWEGRKGRFLFRGRCSWITVWPISSAGTEVTAYEHL